MHSLLPYRKCFFHCWCSSPRKIQWDYRIVVFLRINSKCFTNVWTNPHNFSRTYHCTCLLICRWLCCSFVSALQTVPVMLRVSQAYPKNCCVMEQLGSVTANFKWQGEHAASATRDTGNWVKTTLMVVKVITDSKLLELEAFVWLEIAYWILYWALCQYL